MVCQGPQELRIADKDSIVFLSGSKTGERTERLLNGLKIAVMLNMAEEPI
jgi:hypothetical protein